MTCEALKNFNPLHVSAEALQLNACYEISFALTRMYKNIQVINSGINAKIIQVSDTTLMQVASNEYQDATLWTFLAEVNQLQDFMITFQRTLLIPPNPGARGEFGS